MEDSLKKLIFGFTMAMLFTVLVLTVVVNQGNIYGKNTSEVVGGSLSLEPFNQSVQSVEGDAENLRQSFEKQNIFSVVAGIVVTGIFTIAKAMILMIIAPYILIAGILINVLHVPIIVADVISGLLSLTIIFSIWRLIKAGS